MFHDLAEDIAFLLIKNKIADIEQRDIYIYGLEVILLNAVLMIVFFIISLLCGEMLNFLAYILFFIPIRTFSGGYHAETSERCFILSTIMYGVSIAVLKCLPMLHTSSLWRSAGIISILIILTFSPLINKNNPLNEKQKKRNRIIVCLLLIFDLAFFILSCKYTSFFAANELFFIILDAVLLLIGKLKLICQDNAE